jgi:hypothetical protein
MKRMILLLLLCTCILLPLGCANNTSVNQVKLGEEFSLAIGQTVTIQDENLKVKFSEVIEDSRCPGGVQCIWAGRVSCLIEFIQNGTTNKTVLTQLGLTEGYATETYEVYQLRFRIEPYPQSGKKISNSDYRLLLTISK